MATYNQLIHQYRDLFMKKSLSPEVVKAFVFELCNEYGINLYLDLDKETDEMVLKKFNEGIERLLNDEPLNYVLGYTYFYGYKMIVNEKVLIPRPETEELTALILSQYDEYYAGQDVNVCDVGTGSGAIAIALKKEEDHLRVYASDISEDALSVAKENASLNDCEITFFQGSMLEPYIENGIKVDILVSNPPYIRQNENIERSVYDYEPHVALFGGEDGLRFYREIFENAHQILKENGMLFFEIGYDQKENLTKLAEQYFPDSMIKVFKDINGKDRMLMIKL
ncbi:MAG: peptide chain release factor N(5)-glutamine methyltransferase [Erysipelotrichaceae bacterium]|nr:peptide chain release factor N(5)-glutamine methyltransferase [Erysipelotrichaceae bacterium]